MNSSHSGTPRPVFTPMCVYGLTLHLVKPPFGVMYLVDVPPPSFLSQRICRAGGQTLCVSTGPLVPGEALYRIHRQSLNTHRVNTGLGAPKSWRSGPETDTDLCQCFFLSIVFAHFTRFWLNFKLNRFFFFSQCTLASIASLASRLSLTLAYPPGFLWGVKKKRSSEAPEILLFARLYPDSRGFFLLRVHPLPSTEGKGPDSFAH